MSPAEVADGCRAGNKGGIFPQYIPYFTAIVALPAKIDNPKSVIRIDFKFISHY
jgi:hypothetical protein